MSVKSRRDNFRVEVTPIDPGDLGSCSIGSRTRTEDQTERLCEEIASNIRRHVDDLPSSFNDRSRGVQVCWDTVKECGFCGARWTEDSQDYNGGCCDEDQKSDPEDTNDE